MTRIAGFVHCRPLQRPKTLLGHRPRHQASHYGAGLAVPCGPKPFIHWAQKTSERCTNHTIWYTSQSAVARSDASRDP